jgi:hypothetical protein
MHWPSTWDTTKPRLGSPAAQLAVSPGPVGARHREQRSVRGDAATCGPVARRAPAYRRCLARLAALHGLGSDPSQAWSLPLRSIWLRRVCMSFRSFRASSGRSQHLLGCGWLLRLRVPYRNSGRNAIADFLADWREGEELPWPSATNLATQGDTLRADCRRMWSEKILGHLEGIASSLETTRLRSSARLSRLTPAAAPLYVWFVTTGARTIKNGQRHWADR